MNYRIQIVESALKELDGIQQPFKRQIATKLRNLAVDPYLGAKKLVGFEYWRHRSGDYRIISLIDETNKIVTVRYIRHRKEAYRKLR